MTDLRLYKWEWILWNIEYDYDDFNNKFSIVTAVCPNCKCKLEKSKEHFSRWEYKYKCIQCDFKITFDKSIEDKGSNFSDVIESKKYKDAEIVNIDWDIVRIQRTYENDDNYWVDAKIWKNRKGEVQLMVMAWVKTKDWKVQLFLDPKNEKLSFDHNDNPPAEIFSKVIAVFKNSNSEITCDTKETTLDF